MRITPIIILTLLSLFFMSDIKKTMNYLSDRSIPQVFNELATHPFHPLNNKCSRTIERTLDGDGIADLNDTDWMVRTLAVRDLVRKGINGTEEIEKGLLHPSMHVRQVTAKVLGILSARNAVDQLELMAKNDSITMVRSEAIIALGQMESKRSLNLLRTLKENDPSRDVRHQSELAIYQIENQMGVTPKNLSAWLALDQETFNTVQAGKPAPDFNLEDTEGKSWKLSTFRNDRWVVLIWIFADWCPVCHGEFHDLMEMQEDFKNAGVAVFSLEMHDTYRGRVMVGKELEPDYWFSKDSFIDAYTRKIWWPHLLDRAGAYGARFGADLLAFAVNSEYINRPTTVIIDPAGKVRLIYRGKYWGDRPTIRQTLEMIRSQQFNFQP